MMWFQGSTLIHVDGHNFSKSSCIMANNFAGIYRRTGNLMGGEDARLAPVTSHAIINSQCE